MQAIIDMVVPVIVLLALIMVIVTVGVKLVLQRLLLHKGNGFKIIYVVQIAYGLE